MSTPALEIRDLVVSYGDRQVVRNLTLDAHAGAITAVLGPNGAGKTTTIECAEGLRTPNSGSITVLGHAAGSPAARARVGVMLQDGGLPMARSAQDVLNLACAMHSNPVPTDELLTTFGLQDARRTPVRRLSGGQRQRLAFAVAIASRPAVVFLDEPSAGLDPHARRDVWSVVRSLRDAGTAVVLTTHLIDEAEALADQVHLLVDGAVIASGTPRELVAQFAGDDTVRLVLARPLTALELADLSTAVAPTHVEVDGEALILRGDASPSFIARLARWCADHEVAILTLRAGGGTLELAYLALTERATTARIAREASE